MAPPVAGGVDRIAVSDRGVLWAIPDVGGGVSRLENGAWVRLSLAEPGKPAAWLKGGFALRSEELWAASYAGPIRLEGDEQRLFPDALAGAAPASIAAGPRGVWLAADGGGVAFWDGLRWTPRAAPRGAVDPGDSEPPRVVATQDGRGWLIRSGLWTEEGNGWRELDPPGVAVHTAWWIGAGPDRIWLWDWCNYAIAAITSDGKVAARFTMADLGLPAKTRIGGLSVAGDRIWLATGAGLLLFQNGTWRNAGHPPRSPFLWQAAAAPDGGVWVVANRADRARVVAWVGPPIAFFFGSLILIGLLIAMWIHGALENRLATQTAAGRDAAPLFGTDLAAEQARVARQGRALMWMCPVFFAGVPVAWFGLSQAGLVGARIPSALVMVGAALAGFWWLSRDERTGSAPGAGWLRYVLVAAALAVWVRYAPGGWLGYLVGVLLIVSWRAILGTALAKSAWKRGDYDSALRALRRLQFGMPGFRLLQLEGLTLALANRHKEAEQAFRRALQDARWAPAAERSSVLACLGQMLNDQGRFDEGRRFAEAAIRMNDPTGSHRMTVAESYLKQRIEPQKALDLIDEAMRIPKPRIKAMLEGGRLSSRAWALALLGRAAEAEETIARIRPSDFPAMRSMTHLHIGLALLALNQPRRAAEHLRAAIDADPKGSSAAQAVVELKMC